MARKSRSARRPGVIAANGHAGPGARRIQRGASGRRRGRRNDVPGAGAGALPTASSVVADVIDLGRRPSAANVSGDEALGPAANAASACGHRNGVRSRFYLRVLVQDKPGMLADVARVLADQGISIASVIQHEALEEHQGEVVPLVIMTHYAETGPISRGAGEDQRAAGRRAAGRVLFGG